MKVLSPQFAKRASFSKQFSPKTPENGCPFLSERGSRSQQRFWLQIKCPCVFKASINAWPGFEASHFPLPGELHCLCACERESERTWVVLQGIRVSVNQKQKGARIKARRETDANADGKAKITYTGDLMRNVLESPNIEKTFTSNLLQKHRLH